MRWLPPWVVEPVPEGVLRTLRGRSADRATAPPLVARLASKARAKGTSAVSHPIQVAVLGGGVAGLAAGLALQDAGVPFQLCEAGRRWGGVIRTDQERGFLLEAGPDSLLAAKPEAAALCRRLNLESRMVPTNPTCRRTYFLEGGRLHPLPDGMFLAVPTKIGPFLKSALFSWRGKLRMGLDVLRRPRPSTEDESISVFLGRHFGREAVEKLGEPWLAGIHAGDPDHLSIQATFPRFVELERRHGSLILGMWRAGRGQTGSRPSGAPFFSLLGGLEELTRAIVEAIPAGSRRLGTAARSLERTNGAYRVALEGGASLEAKSVILAMPASRSAEVLESSEPRTASTLRELRFASSATVFLGYPRDHVRHPLDGYGLLVPRNAGVRTTACTFMSTKLPGRAPEGKVLLRGFLGGARDGDVLSLADDDLVSTVRSDMAPVLGLEGEPELARVYRWPDTTPQLGVGHAGWIEGIERSLPAGLVLAGAGYRGVGIPDAIGDGQRAAQRAIAAIEGGGT